ncbi:pregnancy zone protein-like [Megachile rotundata]|uniref:pregnancy zone protein-like n=1 Tax=Megachile rotundata TaxID=143995 RepID=UPI003FCF5018
MDKLSVILVLVCSVGVVHSLPAFLAEVPELIISGKNLTFRIDLLHVDPPASYYINLFVHRRLICQTRGDMPPDRKALATLYVPPTEPTTGILNITVIVPKYPNFLSGEEKNVTIVDKKIVVFMDTDKKVYEPGEIVRIRIIIKQESDTEEVTFPRLWLTNPVRNEPQSWKNVFVRGLTIRPYRLPQNAKLGNWTVSLQVYPNLHIVKTASFLVKKTIKPNFHVIIYPPSFVLADQTITNWTICVRREDGSFPQGNLLLTLNTDTGVRGTVSEEARLNPLNGCYKYTYEGAIFNIDEWYQMPKYVILTANFTEDGTGAKEGVSSRTKIYNEALKLKFRQGVTQIFKLGLPHFETLEVKFPDGTMAPNQNIQLCLSLQMYRQKGKEAKECNDFKSDRNGLVTFVVPPQLQSTRKVFVNAVATDYSNVTKEVNHTNIPIMTQPTAKTELQIKHAPSGNYLVIFQKDEHIECKKTFSFTVLYTLKDINKNGVEFIYNIYRSTDTLLESSVLHVPTSDSIFDYSLYNVLGSRRSILNSNPIYLFNINVTVTPNMAKSSEIEVSTTLETRERVSDVAKFFVDRCLPNPVTAMFIAADRTPGSPVKYEVQAAPGSYCEVSIVEKPLSNNPLLQPNVIDFDQVYNEIEEKVVTFGGSIDVDTDCDGSEENMPGNTTDNSEVTWNWNRRKRWTGETRKLCYEENIVDQKPEEPVEEPEVQYIDDNIDPETTVKQFPQKIWVSESLQVGANGVGTLDGNLPNSVTDWNGYTICTSPYGLGVAAPASISAFQSFVFNYDLPHSAKLDEEIIVKVQIRNLEQHNLPVKLELENIPEIEVVGSELTQSFCVGALIGEEVEYTLKPRTPGTVNVTIVASMDMQSDVPCTTADLKPLRDTVTKQLVIVPEGQPIVKTRTSLICPEDQSRSSSISWNVTLPDDRIPNSESAYLNVVPDVVGLTSENMNKLLPVPKDCGEQNMLLLISNFLALKYMDAFKVNNPEIRQNAVLNLEDGYQRQYNFKLTDGSYAPFVDGDSSIWLSAYVMKWLTKFGGYTYVNENDLRATKNWIVSKQLDNGCFPLIGSIARKEMKSGLQRDNSSPALTAYVLLSLLESGVSVSDRVVTDAVSCLENKMAYLNDDLYATVLTTYAFALQKHRKSQDLLTKLMNINSPGSSDLQWSNYADNPSWALSVEMKCYTILTLMKLGGEKNLNEASKSVHWILTQRNSMGGFVTTQDTAVCLQALTEYAIYLNNRNLDLTIHQSAREMDKVLTLRKADRLTSSQVRLPVLPTTVGADVSNSGCAIIQLETKYNVASASPRIDAFDFSLDVHSEDDSSECKTLNINICAQYKLADRESNMVLLEVGLLSGYKADLNSLELLLRSSRRVKQYENPNDIVYIYFDKLTEAEECVSFKTIRKELVNNLKPANVKIFDYYQPEYMTPSTYQLPSQCSKNLPSLSYS